MFIKEPLLIYRASSVLDKCSTCAFYVLSWLSPAVSSLAVATFTCFLVLLHFPPLSHILPLLVEESHPATFQLGFASKPNVSWGHPKEKKALGEFCAVSFSHCLSPLQMRGRAIGWRRGHGQRPAGCRTSSSSIWTQEPELSASGQSGMWLLKARKPVVFQLICSKGP